MEKRLDLNGVWTLSCDDASFKPIPANLPGDNYSALLREGLIKDPFLERNELDAQWPRERIWTWTREIEVDNSLLNSESVFLNCDSLDTCGEIRINGKTVVSSDNMFCRIRTEVRQFLQTGKNTLEVIISPVGPIAEERAKQQPFPLEYYRDNRLPHMNLIRKIQCQSGWDWGVCVMVSGIYGAFYLQSINSARIEYVNTEQIHKADGSCLLKVFAEITAQSAKQIPVTFSFNGESKTVSADCSSGKNIISSEFEIQNSNLWYPAGYGGQFLYDLEVSTPDDTLKKRIGLRKLELITAPDEIGSPMAFRVNGIDIFAKGANWIPMDAMPERYTRKEYERLLNDSIAANMNMLRVWGGGLFEFDDFYDLCDEKGIMVWQDCMFACMQYPADPEFLASVDSEVRYQVRRLRDHVSISLWCGDNEMAGCIPQEKRDIYLIAYDRLNRTLEKAVNESDPTRVFWPSSPCNGPLTEYNNSWGDDTRGDRHYWGVWHGGQSFSAYCNAHPRFCSEFGFQSFPCQSTVELYTAGKGRNVTSPVMEHHQRNGSGNSRITEMMTRYFRFPSNFENFIYISQVQQAEAIQTGVEYWRLIKPVCMGTLYWQLNDNWPVASWSSIDYYGNWKQLHYRARRFYSPVIVTTAMKNGKLEIWAVSDVNAPFTGEVKAVFRNIEDGTAVRTENYNCSLNPLESRKLAEVENEYEPEKVFMTLSLSGKADNREFTHYNDRFFTEYKHCDLPNAHISAHFEHKDGNEWNMILETDKPAFYVFAEFRTLKTVFSDNSFTLLPDSPRTLSFTLSDDVRQEDLEKELIIRDLRSSYDE